MESLYRLPFAVLEVPNLRIKKPSWLQQPSAMVMFSIVLLSYFLVTGGIIYDVIVEPPSVGSTTDEHGHSRPVRNFKPKFTRHIFVVVAKCCNSHFILENGDTGFCHHSDYTPKIL
ncbi:hypothetical protein B566_EDAN005967 [Ephemera danica]|nr:hypothetical protein B566_EDAN005967 [Ephemera danica]